MNEKDPFWFCELGGCEGADKHCISDCSHGVNSGCPPIDRVYSPTDADIAQCEACGKRCTKGDSILGEDGE